MTKQLITNNAGEKPAPIKVISCWFSVISSRSGQSLIEVMIGLAIGAIMIGASALAVSSMLGSSVTTQKWRSASGFSQGLLDNVRIYGSSNWQNLYGLTKASSTQYFLNASGTAFRVIQGKEGMLDNDVTNGLVGQWKFDELSGSTAYDSTVNGNNGTLAGTISRTITGCKIAYCVNATGTSATVNLGFSTLFDYPSFSFSMWINPNSINAGDMYNNIILGRESYLTSGFRFGIRNDGKLSFWTGQSGGTLVLSSSIAIPLNSFSNVMFSYSSGTANMYINGVLVGTATGTIVTPTNVPLIINGGPGGTQSSNAKIDEFRVYNRALSASEVSQIYKSNIFSRYFYIENTCRTSDASSSISGTSPCSAGSLDDPSTQKINAITEWTSNNLVTTQFPLSDYVTRWQNATLQQNDWSGGASSTAIVSTPTNVFSSSSGIDYSTKAIRIQGL